jgi:hypothetical protein
METKVPFYHIVNIFLPGLIFSASCILLFIDEAKAFIDYISAFDSTGFEVLITISCIAIVYEVGYIIFRLGEESVERIFKITPNWTKYERFVAAQKAGATSLEMLSREYGYARTHIILFFILLIIALTKLCWILFGICIFCIILFSLTALGHIKKTKDTVNIYLAKKNEIEAVNNG